MSDLELKNKTASVVRSVQRGVSRRPTQAMLFGFGFLTFLLGSGFFAFVGALTCGATGYSIWNASQE